MFNGVVLNIAALNYTEDRFLDDPYTFDELVGKAQTIKFDVKEQVEVYGRKIQKSTLDWWKKQSKEAQRQMLPHKDDVSIDQLHKFLIDDHRAAKMDKIYTRSNTFDPILVLTLFEACGQKDPVPWWLIRDTRSFIDGVVWGAGIKNTFVPPELKDKIIKHDSAHDIALDVFRMQYVLRVVNGKENV